MTTAPDWAAQYMDIPFKERGRDRAGCDCYGLVRLVLIEQFHFPEAALPLYSDLYPSIKEGKDAISDELQRGFRPWQLVHDTAPGVVAIFRIHGKPLHCAVMITHRLMLHVTEGISTTIEPLKARLWFPRLLELRRYA